MLNRTKSARSWIWNFKIYFLSPFYNNKHHLCHLCTLVTLTCPSYLKFGHFKNTAVHESRIMFDVMILLGIQFSPFIQSAVWFCEGLSPLSPWTGACVLMHLQPDEASPTWWTWVWASSGRWWWTRKPGVLQSMGSQRVSHDWASELNWGPLWTLPRGPVWLCCLLIAGAGLCH